VLIVEHTEHFRIEKPCILTIGTFDGVHLGHQQLLKRLKEIQYQTGLQTIVLTFRPHPRRILFPEQKDLKLITSTSEKLTLLKTYGIDVTVVYPFTKSFSSISAKEYIHDLLVTKLKVKHLVIGYDHKFGKDRGGDIHTLKAFAPEYGFEVEEISAKDIDSIAISSSKIRQALEAGNILLANTYLGHSYAFEGVVTKGKQLGRNIGYPTANIGQIPPEKLLPAKGVYFARAHVKNETFYGMLNIGNNPTTDNDEILKTEINLFNFNGDIYNQSIRIEVLDYLRAEQKFKGLDELKSQLARDKQNCQKLIENKNAH
jgi:riboflavin kinase / FMN adenylyltransferase